MKEYSKVALNGKLISLKCTIMKKRKKIKEEETLHNKIKINN